MPEPTPAVRFCVRERGLVEIDMRTKSFGAAWLSFSVSCLALGADEAKLREEMKNPEIIDMFSRTYELANKLAITGTPSYVVGNEVVFGALGKDVLTEKIAAAKACESTSTC